MIKEIVYGEVVLVVLGVLFGSIWNESIMMFSFFLGICLLSRYPKVAIVDTFIVIDLVDFFTFYVAAYYGSVYALAMIILGTWLPQAYSIGESPQEGITRTVALVIALALFNVLQAFGVALLLNITIGIFVSMLLWAAIAVFIFHVPDPRFLLMVVAKPIMLNRILAIIGCC